jgi:hypothetical protein
MAVEKEHDMAMSARTYLQIRDARNGTFAGPCGASLESGK